MNCNFDLNDHVEVIDPGEIYSTFDEWFEKNAPHLAARYAYCGSVRKGTTGKVKAAYPHCDWMDKILVAFETDDEYLPIYLIGQSGLKKV